jgi:hypothetical protein
MKAVVAGAGVRHIRQEQLILEHGGLHAPQLSRIMAPRNRESACSLCRPDDGRGSLELPVGIPLDCGAAKQAGKTRLDTPEGMASYWRP